MELFEVYSIYTERHDLIDAIPDIREQIETGNYDEKVCDFLQIYFCNDCKCFG